MEREALFEPRDVVFDIDEQASLRATIGGVDAPVAFAGAQGELAGLDQVNLQLPASLRGRGDVAVILTVDGVTTNSVNINVR